MAQDIGKVTKIENDWMYVKVPVSEGCTSCGLKSACTFTGPDSAYRYFKLPIRPDVSEGDRVKLEIRESAQNISALILFGSPILIFIVSYLLISKIFQISHSEVWSVIATIVLYGITLVISNRWL
ncbi:MAG: SoxR reducing system RseC family protein, partial [Calditrichia bacterium]